LIRDSPDNLSSLVGHWPDMSGMNAHEVYDRMGVPGTFAGGMVMMNSYHSREVDKLAAAAVALHVLRVK
jgi:hypothetical protein